MQSACMDSHPPSLGGNERRDGARLGSILCRVIRVRSAELHFLNLTSRATGCCEARACLLSSPPRMPSSPANDNDASTDTERERTPLSICMLLRTDDERAMAGGKQAVYFSGVARFTNIYRRRPKGDK